MPFFTFDNASVASSMPSLEPASPSTLSSPTSPAAPNTPAPFSDNDDDIIIITDRTKLDLDGASARLRETGQFGFILNVCPSADRAARMFLHINVQDTTTRSQDDCHDTQGNDLRAYRVHWRWLRGLLYADDKVFWLACDTDIDPDIIPSNVHDMDAEGGAPRDCPHSGTSGAAPDATQPAPVAPIDIPAPPPPLMPWPTLASAICFVFAAGTRAFRRFYLGVNQERVTISPNWLSTEKLVEFASIPLQSDRTPSWVTEHCSEWVVKEVVTCNGGNLCGIDYKLRLTNNEVIWLRDDCLEWVTGACEAVRAFWNAGHCLRPDIAEKFLHQRPTAYCSLEWDAALLEWSTRKVYTGHAYRMVNGRARTAA